MAFLYGRDGEADEEIVKAPLKLKDRLQLIDQLDAISAHRRGDWLIENHCQKVYKDKFEIDKLEISEGDFNNTMM